MANFRTVRGNKATDLDGRDHLYVHCVSKERLELLLQGMSCVELECCELHVSFVDSLDIRRIALCPSVVNGVKVEEMFAECDSPSLIEIYSSCDFKVRLFYDLIGGQKLGQKGHICIGNHTSI
jgi:hypothetical protein